MKLPILTLATILAIVPLAPVEAHERVFIRDRRGRRIEVVEPSSRRDYDYDRRYDRRRGYDYDRRYDDRYDDHRDYRYDDRYRRRQRRNSHRSRRRVRVFIQPSHGRVYNRTRGRVRVYRQPSHRGRRYYQAPVYRHEIRY